MTYDEAIRFFQENTTISRDTELLKHVQPTTSQLEVAFLTAAVERGCGKDRCQLAAIVILDHWAKEDESPWHNAEPEKY